ncbi:glycosyltransferase family 4 protein [Amphibacillus sp. MSJ-3]|uniref:glycosyltransferase family 4 protein n=1 Tax=Amphibacillus sp. MSJ-3 TaxID=2841505 RepID=UPI001C0EDAEC|nr:glycosyltransferase family 4 protein [Amphibacillus sp. MSJ-3]MBU5594396.1 glycosyltransferase family 4 protein [Amphibacillus sp. MSJ-3]
MNITIFIGGLSGGGAERVVCNLGNFLSKRHKVTILTMSNDKPVSELHKSINRVPLIRSSEKYSYITRNIIRLIKFQQYIRKSDTDVYLVMLPATINLMLLHRKLIKVPIIVSERADPETRYETSKVRKWIMKKLYSKADGFVFQTQDSKEYYFKNLGKSGIVIPNAINKEFIGYYHIGERKKNIVSVGRLTEQKNFSMLIRAFNKIVKKHPDYNLIIYGEGPMRNELQKLIEELDLSEKVFLLGYVEDLKSNIVDASLFVLSSNYEGMPNALMEAMALGIPCISTDCPVGGPRFLINNGENGILIPTNNIDKLEQSIDTILSNQKLANEIGKKGTNIANELNFEKIYSRWELYIESTL